MNLFYILSVMKLDGSIYTQKHLHTVMQNVLFQVHQDMNHRGSDKAINRNCYSCGDSLQTEVNLKPVQCEQMICNLNVYDTEENYFAVNSGII